jgi:hypothetical protein
MRVLACALLLSGALGTAPASAWRYGAHSSLHFAGNHFGARSFAGGRSWGHRSWGSYGARGPYGRRHFGFAQHRFGRFHFGYAAGWGAGAGIGVRLTARMDGVEAKQDSPDKLTIRPAARPSPRPSPARESKQQQNPLPRVGGEGRERGMVRRIRVNLCFRAFPPHRTGHHA